MLKGNYLAIIEEEREMVESNKRNQVFYQHSLGDLREVPLPGIFSSTMVKGLSASHPYQ